MRETGIKHCTSFGNSDVFNLTKLFSFADRLYELRHKISCLYLGTLDQGQQTDMI